MIDMPITSNTKLALFCSVKCPGDLILKTYDLVKELRDNDIVVISGYATPGGKIEALYRKLLSEGKSIFTFDSPDNSNLLAVGSKGIRTAIDLSVCLDGFT
jgi:hypothetical protein